MMASDLETDPETVKNLINISKKILVALYVHQGRSIKIVLVNTVLLKSIKFYFSKIFWHVFKVDLSDLTFVLDSTQPVY